jgi:hypothetical protein
MREILAIILALCLVAGAGGFVGNRLKQAEWDRSIIATKDAQDKALDAAAKAVAQLNITQQTIVQKVQHEVQTKTVYRDCVVPDDGSRLLNAAISNQEPASGDGVQTTP